ncbi:MAG TPA: type I pullulanase [Ferruginibacter sp.]|nr:type I pullulanase [Ferruginibacter sp.]HMP21690.1 type I pullulanase [Ferruginibacter sp.]
MKKTLLVALCIIAMLKSRSQIDYSSYPVYTGNDLGLTYTPAAAVFKIWSPVAQEAELLLYKEGDGGDAVKKINLAKDINGTWQASVPGDWKNFYYTFRVNINGNWSNEVPDPYAKAAGVNGKRAMVVDLKATNPPGWDKDKSPAFSATNATTDAVLYELHVRDATIHASSGVKQKGKFVGLTELNTLSAEGLPTGLSHLKEMGVTHVHLLPFYDYNSVDESRLNEPQYNWGYDPLNYNVPEGSYSTNPYDGAVRIKELKQMIAAFHKNGLRVVMDVVYNHVADAGSSSFNQLVPGYYFRQRKDGSFSDATACGNETASERPMMRKFILESVLYWAKEYHIDGFRFDLMGVHDIETMNLISKELHAIRPDIVLYGEGWTAGESPLPDSVRALKKNAYKLDRIAVFSDDIRDGIKGSVFDIDDRGFASAKPGMEESVKFGITAALNHPQVNMQKVNYSKAAYATAPWNVVTYCECHDNNTLWDKLTLSCKDASPQQLQQMHRLALTIVLTSQGIPFLHAGTEFFRSKKGVENSYNAPDSINAINWSDKQVHRNMVSYVQQLIQLRRSHPAFRMTHPAQVYEHLHLYENVPEGIVAYSINGTAVNDKWKKIYVAFNGNKQPVTIQLPAGTWKSAMAVKSKPVSGSRRLSGFGAIILYQD